MCIRIVDIYRDLQSKDFFTAGSSVEIGSSGVVSISSDMTYNVLEVHFYVAISKCKV